MRNFIKSLLLWTLGLLSAVLVGLVFMVSCRHMSGHHPNDLDTVAINPAFAAHPPIAQDPTIQKLIKETRQFPLPVHPAAFQTAEYDPLIDRQRLF